MAGRHVLILGGTQPSARVILSASTIAEDAAGLDEIGTASVANGSGTYTWAITADPDSKFAIDESTGVLSLAELATLDYETATSHLVTIEADNGVDDPISRTFTISVTDVDEGAPTVSSFTPADNAVDVAISATSLFITFNEAIQFGTSVSVRLYKTDGDTLVQEWTEEDTETLIAGGDQLEAVLDNPLDAETDYYVQITAGSVEDMVGNAFAGIADETTWNFTTESEEATVPDAFEVGDWSIAAGDEQADVTISSLPADGGDTITDIEYRVDGGSPVSSGTDDTTGFTIPSLTNDQEYDVEIRAVNSVGAGTWSDAKAVTPTAASTWSPLDPSTPAVIWLDPSDLSSMWKERTGASATTAAEVDDVVGTVLNKGSAGGYAVADTDAARPILRQSGGRYYLEFDGTDDLLTLPIGTIGNNATLGIAMRDTAGSDGIYRSFAGITHVSSNVFTSPNTWVFSTGPGGLGDKVGIFRASSTTSIVVPHSRGVDLVYIAKQTGSGASTALSLEQNGGTPTTATIGSHIIGSASNNPFMLGRASNGSGSAVGVPYRMYGVAMAAADWTGDDLDAFRTYFGNKAGLSL